jgi:hypothetical protein
MNILAQRLKTFLIKFTKVFTWIFNGFSNISNIITGYGPLTSLSHFLFYFALFKSPRKLIIASRKRKKGSKKMCTYILSARSFDPLWLCWLSCLRSLWETIPMSFIHGLFWVPWPIPEPPFYSLWWENIIYIIRYHRKWKKSFEHEKLRSFPNLTLPHRHGTECRFFISCTGWRKASSKACQMRLRMWINPLYYPPEDEESFDSISDKNEDEKNFLSRFSLEAKNTFPCFFFSEKKLIKATLY